MLDKDIKKILVSEEEIFEKSKELGQIIAKEYADKKPLLVGYFEGSDSFYGRSLSNILMPILNRLYGCFKLPWWY